MQKNINLNVIFLLFGEKEKVYIVNLEKKNCEEMFCIFFLEHQYFEFVHLMQKNMYFKIMLKMSYNI